MNKILIKKIISLACGLTGIASTISLIKIALKLNKENHELKTNLIMTEGVLKMSEVKSALDETLIEKLEEELERERSKTKKS